VTQHILRKDPLEKASITYMITTRYMTTTLAVTIALLGVVMLANALAEEDDGRAVATFAGGCFWCMEPPFDALDGVLSTTSGYTGGPEENPTYKQVSSGKTGHTEAIQIVYDPDKISYAELLQVFWRNIDPTTTDRQFCDWGSQYRTAIFYHDDAQKKLALSTKKYIETVGLLDNPIVTEIVMVTEFYPAEDYHQDFYKKNPDHYKSYRRGCGRDRRLQELWGAAEE
jgi:peptide-methionine (S)-S-oxide reductase